MTLLSKIYAVTAKILGSVPQDPRAKYMVYKIVGGAPEKKFALTCCYSSVVFYADLSEIVHNPDLLHGLHPLQACYVGSEHAKCLQAATLPCAKKTLPPSFEVHRYGRYCLQRVGRYGHLVFVDGNTQEQYCMAAFELAQPAFIEEFDAAQAFYIGLRAGAPSARQCPAAFGAGRAPHLWVVKNKGGSPSCNR